ncbi:MAG TPA: M56 family metallopeptidase [Isosphaeraceae bacterium]|jgi:hypothetical protein|nr:M56 family metallopeptidase [Isosphaeraceae bacterium]
MNDLAATLLWGAVRASIVLAPAALLHALATRRSPAAGAWVAALALALTLPLGLVAIAPRAGMRPEGRPTTRDSSPMAPAGGPALAAGRTRVGLGWSLAGVRASWERLGHTAIAPARRFGRWSGALALAVLAGVGLGLGRLLVDLGIIGLARRRGRPVEDRELIEMLESLRIAMGCRRPVSLVEVRDLGTPATAGWRRAVIFLPEGWRSWDIDERRAVLAHELAHVRRADFASGLLARVATAIHFYHPLAHWLAARLRLQQELAADALGARFAGGRRVYLLALSRLALRQDGRPPSWPARAFLPARGTLIRRIAMLRTNDSTERPWSKGRRLAAAAVLVGVALGALTLRVPARGEEPDKAAKPAGEANGGAFDLSYVPEDAMGFVAIRPAALFRHAGMGRIAPLANAAIAEDIAAIAKAFKVVPDAPAARPIRIEDIEQLTVGVTVGPIKGKKVVKDGPTHQMMFGGLAVRMAAPFDGPAQLRAWGLEPIAARDGDGTYYRLNNKALGEAPCVYCPDDRTAVFDEEDRILRLMRRPARWAPAYAGGEGWERLRSGLVLIALDNRGGRWTEQLKPSSAEEVGLAASFEHAERWALGLADADDLALDVVATCADDRAAEATERATGAFLAIWRKLAAGGGPAGPKGAKAGPGRDRLKAILDGLRVVREARAVVVRSAGSGTLAEGIGAMVGALGD